MPSSDTPEQVNQLLATRICDLGLKLQGSRLEPLITVVEQELVQAGVVRLKPHFYLSTEWGVPFGSISVAIPFYLARADLIAIHARQVGFLEGAGRGDLLRYYRHEIGHVVNYAYRLYERDDWTKCYGDINVDYVEEFRLRPFSPNYVCHLPGWYAQKHPDEDWAECFALWLTPGYDWRAAYAGWPQALAKLEFCDRLLKEINQRDPDVVETDLDEEVSTLTYTLQQFYDGEYDMGEEEADAVEELPSDEGPVFAPALDAPLRGIFENFGDREDLSTNAPRLFAGDLIRQVEHDLAANVYRWTGCFPERIRPILRQMAERADELKQVYPADHETEAILAVTSLVTALAMDHVVRKGIRPEDQVSSSQGAATPVTE